MLDEKVLLERLEELYNRNDKAKEKAYEEEDWETLDLLTPINVGVYRSISIVNQLAEESNNGWIPCSERLPRIGEQVMVCNTFGSVFVSHITYLNPRVDIHGRCHDFGSHYNVIAWQPLPAPYQPKDCNTCANNTDFNEVDNGCYMCCKGYENNYQPKE